MTDEYPEWIREQMALTLLNIAADTSTTSTAQLQDWVLPVELDLHSPTFIELNSLTIWLDAPDTIRSATATAAAGELCLDRMVHVYIMNERRTVEPTLSDNAVIMRAVLNHRQSWIGASAAAANQAQFDLSKSRLRAHRNFEDERTGMGLLITQPRIFILVVEVDTQGNVDFDHTGVTNVGFKMTFRLTDDVDGEEFWTEMIAKFS